MNLVIRIEPTIIGKLRATLAEVFLTTAVWFAKPENMGFIQDAPMPAPVEE